MSVVQRCQVLSKHADHRREGVQDPTARCLGGQIAIAEIPVSRGANLVSTVKEDQAMLVLTRKANQRVFIGGTIEVRVLETCGGR